MVCRVQRVQITVGPASTYCREDNTQHYKLTALSNEMAYVMIEQDEMFLSHDVVSMFTNTPIDDTLHIIRKRLEQDSTLNLRTHVQVGDIMVLLQFVDFNFRDTIYQHKFGTAMGSPVSPVIANLFVEWLEQQAIATTPVTLSRLRFSGRYNLSNLRFCACAINVTSSICSETTKYFLFKCRGLFVNSSVMITVKSCLKCCSILHLFKSLSRIKALYSHVIYACYQNMPQNLFAS